MNLQEYINSGILELYVLDRLSLDERREVEQYAREYPEVRQELEATELALERYALLHGTTTPPSPEVLSGALSALPKPSSPAAPPAKGNNWLTWLLALALGAALFLAFYYYQQGSERETTNTELRQRFTTLEQDCERIRDANRENRQQLALLTDTDTRDVLLAGTDNAPDSRAVVFYNPTSGETLFSAANLPPPPAGRQYQLWAINENGPQDLGVLDLNLSADTLLDVRFVPGAAAFAITLETEGGQPSPDLSQLQVIGELTAG